MPKKRDEQTVYSRNIGYDMRIAYDSSGRQEYIGYAYPGASDGGTTWQIFKLSYDSNGRLTHRRYADSTDDFTKEWDERTTYDYVDI